jgi:phospholipid/cholesterol/gamma-HCH transport system substrate-binding protein
VLSQVNRKGKLVHVVDNLVTMTDEMNKIMPQLLVDSPELGRNLAHIAKNTAILTDELQKTLPMIQEIGPELPRASRRAMEALDETVVTLKALQKSFLLRGSVKDVREEETNRDRQPASSLPASQDGSAHRAGPAPANAKGGN